jgi:5-methylcytosine-specific restriction endonuclease McrA
MSANDRWSATNTFKTDEKIAGRRACVVCGWEPPRRFSRLLHVHHIVPVAAGGTHERENLILLCPNHHSLAHAMFPCLRGYYSGPRDRASLLEALADPEAFRESALAHIKSLLR